MKKGQSAATKLSNQQKQIIYSGILGDGCLQFSKCFAQTAYIKFNGIHLEYIKYKQNILNNISNNVKTTINRGFKKAKIHSFSTYFVEEIYQIGKLSIEKIVNNLDEFGISLWVYDDGSLHKRSNFYNLNTHAFREDIQREVFIPFFNKRNIFPTIAYDRKKDGRVFTYLRINKNSGADIISEILNKNRINCFDYKIWSSETKNKE